MNFFGEIEGVRVQHTGVFLDDEDWAWLNDYSWGTRALSWAAGKAAEPADRLRELFRVYGLPPKNDGVARWAYHPESRELLYAWPAMEDTPTVSATFVDGSTTTIHNADAVAAAVGTRRMESRR